MRNEATFRAQGLIPIQVPDFNFGYAFNQQIWIKAQPSDITPGISCYTSVHAYMFDAFGGAGTTWFQENRGASGAAFKFWEFSFGESFLLHVSKFHFGEDSNKSAKRTKYPQWKR